MRLRLLTIAVLLLAALAAAPALARGSRGRVNPHFRAQPNQRVYLRSRFIYRDPYQWEAQKNLLRYRSRPYGYYGGYYESFYYGGGQRFIGR